MKKINPIYFPLTLSLFGFTLSYFIPSILSLLTTIRNKDVLLNTLDSGSFVLALNNTFLILSISIPLIVFAGIIFSFYVLFPSKHNPSLMLFLLIPTIIPSVVICPFWNSLFNNEGFVNHVLELVGISIIDWNTSKLSIIIPILILAWRSIGITSIFFYTGLCGIPKEIWEDAEINGASYKTIFCKVVVPNSISWICISVLGIYLQSYNVFRDLYCLYGGYPNPNIYMISHYIHNNFLSADIHELSSLFSISLLCAVCICPFIKKINNKELFTLTQDRYVLKRHTTICTCIKTLIIFFFLSPLLFILIRSFISQNNDINIYSESFFVFENFSITQYKTLFLDSPHFWKAYGISLLIIIPVIIGQYVLSIPTAYVLEHINNKKTLSFFYIVFAIIPSMLLLIPSYLIFDFFNIRGIAAIIISAVFNPIGVVLIYVSIKFIGKDYINAARLDGGSELQILKNIVLPNLKKGIFILFLICIYEYYNIIDPVIVFIDSPNNYPLSVLLSQKIYVEKGIVFAASCLYILPIFLVFFLTKEDE